VTDQILSAVGGFICISSELSHVTYFTGERRTPKHHSKCDKFHLIVLLTVVYKGYSLKLSSLGRTSKPFNEFRNFFDLMTIEYISHQLVDVILGLVVKEELNLFEIDICSW
jgi:hypothetical protein